MQGSPSTEDERHSRILQMCDNLKHQVVLERLEPLKLGDRIKLFAASGSIEGMKSIATSIRPNVGIRKP